MLKILPLEIRDREKHNFCYLFVFDDHLAYFKYNAESL